ncbi:hypothetical protein Tco_0217021 [Tanacetum coccineum]
MDSENYKEDQSMQRPPLFEANYFIYWKNRFETYVKSKDIDLWHIIVNGDYKPTITNLVTGKEEAIPYDKLKDENKKMLSKNDEAKMVLYNALPKKEYERIFMCKTAKDIWNSLVITHHGNKQVKDNKIDLFVQQYEQFSISDDETIDCAFARYNTIITSLKALDESFSSRNHVRKFLRAFLTKWRPKVTATEESKDLSTLLLDELIVTKKPHVRIVMMRNMLWLLGISRNYLEEEENSFVNRTTTKRPSKKQRKKRKEKNIVGGWSNGNEDDDPKKDEICLMVHESNEVRLKVKLESDEWIKDSGCSRHMTGNKDLFSTYNAINGGNVVFGSITKSKIIGKGTITHNSLTIHDVSHVENLNFNLLSIG